MITGSPVKLAFLIVAVLLFLLAALPLGASPPWWPGITRLGLAFFAASFLVA